MIKTITLAGLTSVTVKKSPFDMARFCWIYNHSDSDVFASCVNADCTANADGVLRIPAGEPRMLDSESHETLYLNGSGSVEIITSAFAVCPFNRGGKGGVSYELPIATTEILGGVIPDGTSITVDENGVISAVGGSDDWTNVGTVTISTSTNTEFSIPNLSNYKFMMLSISMRDNNYSNNYTRILALDDYKPSSDLYGPVYYIGNDYLSTSSSSTIYPYSGYVTINKSTNKVSFRGRVSFCANIYMK